VIDMNDIRPGQIVYSKAGRDKDHFFLVWHYEKPYVYLVDGKIRRLENPKKKKDKHIQTTNYVDSELKCLMVNQNRLTNADIRNSLSRYVEEMNHKQ